MKKVLVLVLALAMLVSCACALADEPVTLTYSEVNALDGNVVGEVAKAFKAKVEELSGGSVLIDIQAGGVLGTEDQITDIGRFSAFALTQYGCDKAMLLSIPYTFVNEEHFWNFADSELAKDFLLEPQTLGLPLRGLCYGEEGFRHFFFKKGIEVKGIEDLKGLKIRVSADPIMTGMVENLGASATPVSFNELYSALNTGMVDGAEQPTANYYTKAFPEVAPTLLLDGHTLGAIQLIITDAAWAKLNEEQQGWVTEAAQYASQVCRDTVAEVEAKTFETLKAMGVTIVEVEDKTPWVEACQSTIQANTASQAELYQQILDMQ